MNKLIAFSLLLTAAMPAFAELDPNQVPVPAVFPLLIAGAFAAFAIKRFRK